MEQGDASAYVRDTIRDQVTNPAALIEGKAVGMLLHGRREVAGS